MRYRETQSTGTTSCYVVEGRRRRHHAERKKIGDHVMKGKRDRDALLSAAKTIAVSWISLYGLDEKKKGSSRILRKQRGLEDARGKKSNSGVVWNQA